MNTAHLHHDQEAASRTILGVWIYLMTDLVIFATLFAAYAVLRNNTFGGPAAGELFSLPFVLAETLLLLTSSFTIGLATLSAQRDDKRTTLTWLGATLALGLSFLGMEVYEFRHLLTEGESFRNSGFLTAFFTLVGTHGAHIFGGSLAMVIFMYEINRRGFTGATLTKLRSLSLFWHFLDIVWIFIFTFVYLMGALS